MKVLKALLLWLAFTTLAVGQTLPVVNLSVSGTSTFTGAATFNGAVNATGLITNADLATQAANTVLANVTGSTASPTAFTMPSCSTSSSALNYTLGSGWSCNTSINAASLGGNAAATYAPLASPALTGTPTAPTAAAGTNTTQLATTAFAQNAVTGGANAGSFTTLAASGTSTLAGVTATSMTNTGLTAKSFVYSGTGSVMSSVAGTNGQLLIGSTGNAPVAATLTATSGQTTITNGAGSITVGLANPLTVPGPLGSVNGVSTAANGVPIVVGKYDATAQQANIPTNGTGTGFTYAVPAGGAGLYWVRVFIEVTQAATTSSTMPQLQCVFTSRDSSTTDNAFLGATSTANTVGTNTQSSGATMSAKASTNIFCGTSGYGSTGATPMQFSVHFLLIYGG